MKKIIRYVIGISLIVIFLGIVYSTLNYAQAAGLVFSNTPNQQGPDSYEGTPAPQYDIRQLFTKEIPVYCGETSFVLDTSAKLMKESQILVGEVRTGGSQMGEVIGILSFGHSIERDSGTFFMTIPGLGPNNESLTCILGYGMNWQFFDDEGNKLPLIDSL